MYTSTTLINKDKPYTYNQVINGLNSEEWIKVIIEEDTRDRSSEYPRESGNRRSEERRRDEGPSPGVHHLSIIQYNCGNTNHRLARPLLDSLDPEKHYILAI